MERFVTGAAHYHTIDRHNVDKHAPKSNRVSSLLKLHSIEAYYDEDDDAIKYNVVLENGKSFKAVRFLGYGDMLVSEETKTKYAWKCTLDLSTAQLNSRGSCKGVDEYCVEVKPEKFVAYVAKL